MNKEKYRALYNIWYHMKLRCFNAKNSDYHNYGGRGITVCERWLKFDNFLKDMGHRPDGLELDRIDNDGNYEPDNCKWVTHKENCNNMRPRSNRRVNRASNDFIYKYQDLVVSTGRIISQWAVRRLMCRHKCSMEDAFLIPIILGRPSKREVPNEVIRRNPGDSC